MKNSFVFPGDNMPGNSEILHKHKKFSLSDFSQESFILSEIQYLLVAC